MIFRITALVIPLIAMLAAQAPAPISPTVLSMDDAIRIALQYNQTLRGQRINIDESRAGEITAGLKPNPAFSTLVDGIPIFSPSTLAASPYIYAQSLSYTVERGGKRARRIDVAADNTDVAVKTVQDNERQLRFSVAQAFINVLLAKSVLQLAIDDLGNFTEVVDLNRQRVTAGDLAEGDFLRISLQKLQFDQDVAQARLNVVQSRATLRQLLGYRNVVENFDVSGALDHKRQLLTQDELERQALANRPDLLAASSGVKLATDTASLAVAGRTRDWTFGGDYINQAGANGIGTSFSIDIPIHDRNQGEIARSQAAVRQANEVTDATRIGVLTDVVNAFAGLRTADEVVALYESGYLEQATQTRDISNYAFQRGATPVLDLLDAERSYRATQLAYRQAVAAWMIAAQQLNSAVGAEVIR
jgi:outer membrane protein, heavy metal efflux system